MPNFTYKARDTMGKSVRGTMAAATKSELIDKFNKMGYMVTSIDEAGAEVKVKSLFEGLKRVGTDDLLMFYVQFANMISSGISVLGGLATLKEQIENKTLKDTVDDIARQVEAGESLSQAMAGHLRVFPQLFVDMVKAGEASGKLDTVLLRYAEFFEKQQELREKVKSALLYPTILMCAGIAVTLFIVTFVIPQFAEIYMSAGVTLPVPTLIVYKIGITIKQSWYLILLGFVAILLGIRFYIKSAGGRLFFDRLKLNIPIIGPLTRRVAIARFTRTLATLVGSGVPILESLDTTKDVVDNVILARVLENVRNCVEKGDKIAEPLKMSTEFPPDVVQMVAVGEETGRLDEMLNKIAHFYDTTVGYAIKRLTTFIEPFFLIVMGIMIGVIMASMLLPIFDMIKTMGH